MTALPDDILDLLTAYALDMLEPDEVVRVSKLLNEQPALRHELATLRATANQLPYALPEAEPPASLRQRTLDAAVGRAPTQRNTVRGRSSAHPFQRWLVALGSIAAVALVVAGIGWSQLFAARAELAQARATQERVAVVLSQAEPLVALSGSGGRGSVVRTSAGETLVAAQLSPLADDRVYQFWLISGNNAPASGGTFTVDENGIGVLTLAAGASEIADTFAITNEPVGGSASPTTPILVVGKQPTV